MKSDINYASELACDSTETLLSRVTQQLSTLDLAEVVALAGVALNLALVGVIIHRIDLFTPAFRRLVYLANVGWLVNHFLPPRRRSAAFAAFCGVALVVVMGGSPVGWVGSLAVERVAAILGVGFVLASIAKARISLGLRFALLAAVGLLMAACRAGVLASPLPAVIWPALAGFLMFRIIVYAYDASPTSRFDAWKSASYFFLFPNSTTGLFPVVDFKTFVRSHYSEDALTIYHRGCRWITRGLLQLVGYRIIQRLWAITPGDVKNGRDLIQFILTNSLLYLKVSGEFHLFIGLLLMFGFNLPETNRRYFLASSFTDYWRRVNIYWKDFVLKVFYYPMYFKLKDKGTVAVVVATLWAFAATWALHLYQTWWLKGAASMTWPDTLFWLSLAVLVLMNSLWEMRRGRRRTLGHSRPGLRATLGIALRTAGTFAVVSVLWSLWSTPTLPQWIAMWKLADRYTLAWGAATCLVIMLAAVLIEVRPFEFQRRAPSGRVPPTSLTGIGVFFAQAILPLVLVCLASSRFVQAKAASPRLQPWVDAFNTGDSMTDDVVLRNGGYYDQLTKPDQPNTAWWELTARSRDLATAQWWEVLARAPMPFTYEGPNPIRSLNDFRFREFLPNVSVAAYDTEDFRTNRYGMRDRDYELAKPPRTLRIALLGSSHVMGWGVHEEDVFQSIVETRLNANQPQGGAHVRFEILNFATNGVSPLGQIPMLDDKVRAFQPDVVILVAHPLDYYWIGRDLVRSAHQHVPIQFSFLQSVLDRDRVTSRTHEDIAAKRLWPDFPQLLEWCYRQIGDRVRGMSALPVGVFVPVPDDIPVNFPQTAKQLALIQQSGLVPLDLSHIYDGKRPEEVRVSEPYHHTNAAGHKLIADALYKDLTTNPQINLVDRARRIGQEPGDPAISKGER